MAAASLPRAIVLASALALAACGTAEPGASETVAAAAPDTPAPVPTEPAAPDTPAMTLPVDPAEPTDCNVAKAAVFTGRRADPAVRAELAAAVTPVTDIRWVRPGEPTTEDYRTQRLNVMLDVGGVIVSAHCG